MHSMIKGILLIRLLLFAYVDLAASVNKTDDLLSAWETWSACNVTCGPGQQTRSRVCIDIVTNNNCSLTSTEFRICFGRNCEEKRNSSRGHKEVRDGDDTGVNNAVNSAVYSSIIFIPGVIGFIFVCVRTHRKTKMEEKQLRDLESRKLSLHRDDDVT